MPARNAPRAIDAPKKAYEAAAIAIEKTSTVSVNSSRERSRATCTRTHGIARDPPSITIATRAESFSSASPKDAQSPGLVAPSAADASVPSTGISTRMMTVKTSSTSSHPTATWPWGVFSASASINTRMRTTVLATAIAMPITAPDLTGRPRAANTAMPRRVATRLWPMAPGMATDLTASRSFRWKCRPTPNMSRMTPTSAS